MKAYYPFYEIQLEVSLFPPLSPDYSVIVLTWKAYFKTISHLGLKTLNKYFINNIHGFVYCRYIKNSIFIFLVRPPQAL